MRKQFPDFGRVGGQLFGALAFYSDDPSSNLAQAYNFSVNCC